MSACNFGGWISRLEILKKKREKKGRTKMTGQNLENMIAKNGRARKEEEKDTKKETEYHTFLASYTAFFPDGQVAVGNQKVKCIANPPTYEQVEAIEIQIQKQKEFPIRPVLINLIPLSESGGNLS